MSALKPVAKQPRTMKNPTPSKMDAVTPRELSTPHPEESDLRTSLTPTSTETTDRKSHPKGHKVRELEEVWKFMDAQTFLRLSDTTPLFDVLVQPIGVEPSNGQYVEVTFRQIVDAPHIKQRIAKSKLSTDDLLKMLHLCDCLQYDMQGFMRIAFDDWIAEKTASFIKAHGVDNSTNRSMLCNYIITEDREFTFYPHFLKNTVGIFFRKICYHSYKTKSDEKKFTNPSLIKCCATRGKFEYVLEARLVPLPDDWFAPASDGEMEVPESQPLSL